MNSTCSYKIIMAIFKFFKSQRGWEELNAFHPPVSLFRHESTTLGVDLSAPGEPSDDSSPENMVTTTLGEIAGQAASTS